MTEQRFKELYLSQGTDFLEEIIKRRDPFTYSHSKKVAGLCMEFGAYYGFSKSELELLELSALLHDIGNVGIPDNILLKPSNLNDIEYKLIKNHSEIGEQILINVIFKGYKSVAKIIRHHHEYYDGDGYPDGISGEDIPSFSRIIGIADSYSFMADSVKNKKTHKQIMKIMMDEVGHKHDPYFMKIFSDVIEDSRFKAA